MKAYVSPEFLLCPIASEEIMDASEEARDIPVKFKDLWNFGNNQ